MLYATLKEKNGVYYCTHCRMNQKRIEPMCFFCGAILTNYEEIAIKIFKQEYDSVYF